MVGMASFLATFKGSSHRLWRDHSSPIVNRQAEDGGAVDAPGVRRLSGPFFGWALLSQESPRSGFTSLI